MVRRHRARCGNRMPRGNRMPSRYRWHRRYCMARGNRMLSRRRRHRRHRAQRVRMQRARPGLEAYRNGRSVRKASRVGTGARERAGRKGRSRAKPQNAERSGDDPSCPVDHEVLLLVGPRSRGVVLLTCPHWWTKVRAKGAAGERFLRLRNRIVQAVPATDDTNQRMALSVICATGPVRTAEFARRNRRMPRIAGPGVFPPIVLSQSEAEPAPRA